VVLRWNDPTLAERSSWAAFVSSCPQVFRAVAELVDPWTVYRMADGRAARVLAFVDVGDERDAITERVRVDVYAHIAELGAVSGERVAAVDATTLTLWPAGQAFEPVEPQDLEPLARAYLECLPPEDIATIARSTYDGIDRVALDEIPGLVVVEGVEPPPPRQPNRRGRVMTIALLLAAAAGGGARRG